MMSLVSFLLVQDTIILVLAVVYFDQVMSRAEETSGQNRRDFVQPRHQLQTGPG